MTARSSWWPTGPKPTRPRTREEIEVAVDRLADDGMVDYDIANELGLAVVYVRRVLAARAARGRT